MEIPSYTKIYHTTAYPSISPSLPALSTAGRSILVTGAGSGIGPKLAEAFAIAGSTQIALLGRTASTLATTKASLEASHPGIHVLTLVADLKDKSAIDTAFATTKAAFGRIDVLISNAGYFSTGSLVSVAPIAEWWQSMEINVLGNLHLTQAFLANIDDAASHKFQPTIVNVSTLGAHIPALPSLSGYAVSKAAALKLFEYVATENPSVRIMNVHPGSLDTAMGQKGRDAGVEAPFDDPSLPAAFLVWAVSPEAEFLRGKFLWSNWDVDELKERKAEFVGTPKLTMGLTGWPY